MALLSDRLMAVARMITPGLPVADIGCDHAYLPIYLVRENMAPFVVACDVNAGQGDGLSPLRPGEVKSVVLAGMGGKLMMRILSDGADVLEGVLEIIMEPQSEVSALRHYLQDNGFRIISENMVNDETKFYPVIKAVHGEMNWDKEIYFRYGKILLREENPVLHEFLLLERQYCSDLLKELAVNEDIPHVFVRMEEIKTDLALNADALQLVSEPGLFEEGRLIK